MKPQREIAGQEGAVVVALDARPLLGVQTGVSNFCYGALCALSRFPALCVRGYAVTWRRQAEIPGLLPHGVTMVGRPMPARPLEALWSRWTWPPLERFIGPTDVVHGTNFFVPPTRRAGRVVTVHDLTAVHFPEMCEPPSLRFPAIVRRAIEEGAWVHTPSAFVAREVVELLGAPTEKVRAVAHGIPALPPSGGPAHRPELDGRYVLAIGTIEPRKDYQTLLRAFDDLAGEQPDVTLLVVGNEGWGARSFARALEGMRFRDRVRRVGYVPDGELRVLLESASVLAYPSVYEGFGFPPLQAMQLGVPVVASAAGAIPEIVGDASLLVPAGDAGALAEALLSVLSDPEQAARLRSAGLARAGNFTWDACAAGLEALYRVAAP